MAGEWTDITPEDLNAPDNRFVGIEPGALKLEALRPHLAAAKQNLRRKARFAFGPLYKEYTISDTGLFDQVAALPSTGAAADLYEDLRELLRLETLARYYGNAGGRPGKKADWTKRAKEYGVMAMEGLPAVAAQIRDAIASGKLVLTSDVASREYENAWTL